MNNKIFFSELLQDLPLWTSIIMSVYPHLQNDKIFYASLVIGVLSSIYILYMIRKGEYSIEKLFQNLSEAISFSIYSFGLLIFLLLLTVENKLYMSGIVWGYVIISATGELFLMRKSLPHE